MNYDHVNKTYDFWAKSIRPHLTTKFQVTSFDDYLKKLSFCKTYRWLREMESVKLTRLPMALDPVAFVKKYSEKCIAVNPPARPEDGMQRMIFQISPTLHIEAGLWAWVENNELHSYLGMMICHKTDEELTEFLTEVEPLRRTGNTEERNTGFHPGGPMGLFQQPT